MTCPTTAVYDGLPDGEERIPLGKHLRFFGDGYQKSKRLNGRRYWRIPVMDGEFLVEERLGVGKGVAGGNLIMQGRTFEAALDAARRAAESLAEMPGVVTPFRGIARKWQQGGLHLQRARRVTADLLPDALGNVATQLIPRPITPTRSSLTGSTNRRSAKRWPRR
jgi:formylmethanofuran--tetrahydromethanopterin N-formyltransferase